MKMIRKIAMLLLAICLVVPAWSVVSHAANGDIQITDHSSVEVGTSFEVTCAVKSNGSAIGDVDLEISYDTTMLQYESVRCANGTGTLTEASAGNLVFDGSGDGSDSVVRFHMTFYVLKTGTTSVKVESHKAYLASDETLTCTQGAGTISIVAGDAGAEVPPKSTGATISATDLTVDVNGVSYTLASTIPSEEIPEGFAEVQKELEGEERTFVSNEAFGMLLGYLVDAEGKGGFFIYDEEDAGFSPFTKVSISTTTYIIWLDDVKEVNAPKDYQLIELTVNGYPYPVWQKAGDANNYVLYAVNNQGAKGLYQYDIQEGTYQRFSVVEEAPEAEESDEELSGLKKFVVNNYERAMFMAIVVVGFLLLVLIIVGVKLHNRNRELDELYDEYEIDLEDEVPSKPSKPRYVEKEDDEIEIDDFQYEDDYEDELAEIVEKHETFSQKKTMKEESTFEDFDLDFIDLDD